MILCLCRAVNYTNVHKVLCNWLVFFRSEAACTLTQVQVWVLCAVYSKYEFASIPMAAVHIIMSSV